jgi:methylglyoxal/glyoxal reductase
MVKEQLYTTLNTGVKMPLLGLGVYDMYKLEAEQAVTWALETGYRLIDTAAMYQNETEIGNAVRAANLSRKELFITTKVHNTDHGFDATLRAFDVSLRKLNVDYIDLYLVHWPLKASRKDTWLALEKLYADGRVRAVGVANYLEPFLAELKTYASIIPALNQVEFSPYLYLETLKKQSELDGTQLQAYTPLVRGERMSDSKLVALASKYEKTPAQIMLRWIIQHGVSAIPKSVNKARLQENFDIFDFEISASDMALMDTFNENLRVVDNPMDLL